jgi:hypothetical protein
VVKFRNIGDAFEEIRRNSAEYLPEKSLSLFHAFWIGYEMRIRAEFGNQEKFDLLDGFHEFVQRKYRVPSNRSSERIVALYSKNEAEAFDLWSSLLDEFSEKKIQNSLMVERIEIEPTVTDFFSFFERVIKRTPLYVGLNSFTLARTMIAGWFRAARDFGLADSDQEGVFRRFKHYLERRPIWLRTDNDRDLPPSPSWHKLIREWASHVSNEEKALEMFLTYFDEYGLQGKEHIDYLEFHWKAHNELS